MEGRVLIVCPRLDMPGGVAGYYDSLKHHLSDEFSYFFVGSRSPDEGRIRKPINLMRDAAGLALRLLTSVDHSLVLINPSLIELSLIREGLLLRIAKFFKRKCVVFIRGWDDDFVELITNRFFKLFYSTYNRADSFIVLSQEFRDKLRQWGFRQPVYVETTTVDEELRANYRLDDRMARFDSKADRPNLLFLSRVEKQKGIIETIQATKLLARSFPNARLLVAGVGTYLEAAKKHAKDLGMEERVGFLGWISGKAKARVLSSSDVLVLLTDKEGMPNCVLESMAFGIPVVTCPVGGIKDFFVDGRFGFLTESKDPLLVSKLLERILADDEQYRRMSTEAFNYAGEHFLSSSVARRIERICDEMLSGSTSGH